MLAKFGVQLARLLGMGTSGQGIVGVLLAALLLAGFWYFSAHRQRRAAAMVRRYFLEQVFPRGELALHLQKIKPAQVRRRRQREKPPFPPEWVEREADELDSPYFLRTGRQVSWSEGMYPQGGWYGLEAWVQDLVAGRADPAQCARALRGKKWKPKQS